MQVDSRVEDTPLMQEEKADLPSAGDDSVHKDESSVTLQTVATEEGNQDTSNVASDIKYQVKEVNPGEEIIDLTEYDEDIIYDDNDDENGGPVDNSCAGKASPMADGSPDEEKKEDCEEMVGVDRLEESAKEESAQKESDRVVPGVLAAYEKANAIAKENAAGENNDEYVIPKTDSPSEEDEEDQHEDENPDSDRAKSSSEGSPNGSLEKSKKKKSRKTTESKSNSTKSDSKPSNSEMSDNKPPSTENKGVIVSSRDEIIDLVSLSSDKSVGSRGSRSMEKEVSEKRTSSKSSKKEKKRRSRSRDKTTPTSRSHSEMRRSRSKSKLETKVSKKRSSSVSNRKSNVEVTTPKPSSDKRVSDFKLRKMAKEKRASDLQDFLGNLGDTLMVEERSDDTVSFLSVPKDLEDGLGIKEIPAEGPNPMISMNDDEEEPSSPRISYGLEALMNQGYRPRGERWENVSETTEEVETVLGEDMDEEMGMKSVGLESANGATGLERPGTDVAVLNISAVENESAVRSKVIIINGREVNVTLATGIVCGFIILILVIIGIVAS
eukprot:scaffold622_cov102-Cylindrotheca_fusiformis.AAC.9